MLNNPGATDITDAQVTDAVPASLSYVDNSLQPPAAAMATRIALITWTGTTTPVGRDHHVRSSVKPNLGFIVDSAVISGGGDSVTRTATVTVDGPICNLTK